MVDVNGIIAYLDEHNGAVLSVAALVSMATALLAWLGSKREARLRDEAAATRDLIRKELLALTKPIQPGANGGLSLPDVARKVDDIDRRMARIEEYITQPR